MWLAFRKTSHFLCNSLPTELGRVLRNTTHIWTPLACPSWLSSRTLGNTTRDMTLMEKSDFLTLYHHYSEPSTHFLPFFSCRSQYTRKSTRTLGRRKEHLNSLSTNDNYYICNMFTFIQSIVHYFTFGPCRPGYPGSPGTPSFP